MNVVRRSRLVTLLSLTAIMLGLSGISSIATARAQGSTTVDWATDAAWHEAGQNAVGKAAAEAVGVGVHSVIFPTTDAYQAAVRSALPTGQGFPVFDWWSGYRMKDLVDAGSIADLTSLWQKHVAAGEYPQDLMNLFSFDGKAYAAPKLVNYWVVFYNKHVFEENGLTLPQTWQDLMTTADALKAKGVTPFGLDVVGCRWCSFIWFEELLVRTKPQLYNDLMSGKAKYNDPGVADVMKTWKDLIDKGYFTKPGTISSDTAPEAFAQGKFAMYLMGDWWTANLERANFKAGDDYGVFVMPGLTEEGNRSLIVEARPVLVANKSPHKDDALKLVDFFMGTEGQTAWATTSDVNSPNLKVAADTRPAHLRAVSDEVAAGKYSLYLRYWEATPPEIVEPVVDLLGQFVIHPDTSQQVLDQATALADKYWAAHPAK